MCSRFREPSQPSPLPSDLSAAGLFVRGAALQSVEGAEGAAGKGRCLTAGLNELACRRLSTRLAADFKAGRCVSF